MNIQAHQNHLAVLKAEVRAAWIKACEVDGIPTDSKFSVLSNSTEAALFNETMGMYMRARSEFQKQLARNKAKRDRHAAYTSCGLKRVAGGIYE